MAQLTWLITGCSSGFGEAFVHSLLARGDKVIATGRKAETKLAHLMNAGAATLDLDVTAPQSELDAKIKEAIAIYGHIDGLINNAGYLALGLVEELTQQQWQGQLDTNLFGAMNVTKALLPHFRSRMSGKVAFTSSVFSLTSMQGVGAYAVSKHGLAGYAQTLNLELAQFGITTTIFDIGHFRTSVMQNAKMEPPQIEEYLPMWETLQTMAGAMVDSQPGDPKKGVELMIDVLKSEGMAKGKDVPLRIPIGSDACQIARETALAALKTCEEWDALSSSTDFEGPRKGIFAQQQV